MRDTAESAVARVEALCAEVLAGSDLEHAARFGCETAGESDVLIDFVYDVLHLLGHEVSGGGTGRDDT